MIKYSLNNKNMPRRGFNPLQTMQLQGVCNVVQLFFFDIASRVAVFLHTLHMEREILKVMIHNFTSNCASSH